MNEMRQAAARERRFPILWWLVLMVLTGKMLVAALYPDAPHAAVLVGVLLAAAWVAPLVAFASLAAPRRAAISPPRAGGGSYRTWRQQARMLGRVLLYHEDNPYLSEGLRQTLKAARADLRDTLKSHPLRDDLERVCGRLREGALSELKGWLWRSNRIWVHEIRERYNRNIQEAAENGRRSAAGPGRLAARKEAVEDAAAMMVRQCMPRMLERERLACALECSWLASAAAGRDQPFDPIDLAGALVVEWCDFSEPWDPDQMLERALTRLATHPLPDPSAPASDNGVSRAPAVAPAPPSPETGTLVVRNGKRYRRVRVRRRRAHGLRSARGPSILDILLSFGQWLRYSVRSWMMYR